jgi:ATP-dependent RNA helicase SUPV3L1/SUV3
MTDASDITALLGPTNTGKTHRATERMLDHTTGMIGLPLRLLAREVYDKVTARVGEARVALVTGEEKRVPKRPDYWVCTVEAMPVEREVDFVAVDEVQLAAHPQRGHVFTARLLHARGRRETWFLGADTMRAAMGELVPAAKVVTHPRFSRLSHVEPVPLQRLPPRSAVVAFSLPQVYELAERLRIARGGAAVVLGALSPRTRNAQVAMFQAGEVDYLVATDAVGMGLNLDVRHVSFASLRKFDGRDVRGLDPAELAQIAGRAGRHVQDGTFSTVAPLTMPRDLIEAIEQHRLAPVRRVQWRNHALEFASPEALLASLHAPPPMRMLLRARDADDELALAALLARPAVRARLGDPSRVRLLWEVCTVPDFRKLLFEAHVEDLATLFAELCDRGVLRDGFMTERVAVLDDTDGDVDTLVARIAAVRMWTYVSNQGSWVEHAAAWQSNTRAVEDHLSDALHRALVRRFVDEPGGGRPASPRPRGRALPKPDEPDVAAGHPFARLRALRDAMTPRAEPRDGVLRRRVDELVEAPHARFSLDARGRIVEGDAVLGRLVRGASVTLPGVELLTLEGAGGGGHARVQRRMVAWARDAVHELLASLREGASPSPNVRGVLYQLEQGLGTALRRELATLLAALTDEERAAVEGRGVVLGRCVVYAPATLTGEALTRRAVLAAVHYNLGRAVEIPAGAVTLRASREVPREAYLTMGYPVFAGRAVRSDMAERVCAAMRAPEADEAQAARCLALPAGEARAVAAAIAREG